MRHKLVVIACLTMLMGCTANEGTKPSAETKAPQKEKRYRIAVIPKGTTHEFWKSVHYGAAEAAEQFNAEIAWLGPLLEQDRDGQISVVQNFVIQKIDGICLAPIDSQALTSSVRDAANEGIPVVIFDSGLDDPSTIVSYVATDNRHGGELAADQMAKNLPTKGNLLLLRYMVGSESTLAREEGFLQRLKTYPHLKVVSSDQYSGDTPQTALDKAQQTLHKYGDQLDGIFSVCEPNATGTLQALEEADLAGNLVFIGFDPSKRMVQALADNHMQGIVLQDPVKMGYLAVKTMVEHLRGQRVEKRLNTGEEIATPENMKTDKIQRLLNPPQFED